MVPKSGDDLFLILTQEQPWHAHDADYALHSLAASAQGLTAAEADARLVAVGPNRLPSGKQKGPFKRLLLQFHNLLIYALLAAVVISLLMGHGTDALVISAVVVLNAVIGFVQEGRAEQALNAIKGMINPKSSVLRDGRRATIAAEHIVPGDIILIEAGDRVPADVRLIRARNLKIEEAVLTGESLAVEKTMEPVAADTALGDRQSMAYSGTFVAAGQGVGVAVGTGIRTELGRISSLLGAVETLQTPLLRQMDGFAKQLTIVILAVSTAAFFFAYKVRAYTLDEAFMTMVGLAVAAIPEGLPAIMTITLAIGVQRMAVRHAIIRKLPAVETLGSVSVICSDKTGTLTRNEMAVRAVDTATGEYAVSGVGYGPVGAIQSDEQDIDTASHQVLMELIRAGLLCNDADVHQQDGYWLVNGDPMEAALVTLAMKAGIVPADMRKAMPRSDEIPFDADHRFMATLHHDHQRHAFIYIKGAPERVLDMCTLERRADGDTPLDKKAWLTRADRLAAQGLRVLAFAAKPADSQLQTLDFDGVHNGAVLLGFIGFMDPPREEAIAAVKDCRAAGIRVAMITGDHAATAREIARQLGLSDDPDVLTGHDLDQLDEAGLQDAVRDVTVFARTTPEHKLRLVSALQADGLTVAMTGDGVNDAPALKRADVGIAMGQKGTEAAKEASEMVLADDNFASIVAAVREGRTVYDNIMKVISWTLPTNGGEALTILSAIAFGLALPITAIQILWINLVTAVALGLTLAFEPTEPGTMRRPPRAANRPILSGDLLWRIVFVSLLFVAGAFGMFFWADARGQSIETARTLVVNTIVVMEIFYLFSVRYVHGTSLTWVGVLGTPAVLLGVGVTVAAQFLFTYAPFMNTVFASRPLAFWDGVAVVGVGVALLLIVELEKRVRAAFARG